MILQKSHIIILLLCSHFAFAQYQTVEFDYEKSVFNNGQPLPAATYFEIRGQVSQVVTMVEVSIYRENGYPEKAPLYTKSWKRPFNGNTARFVIPINYNLRSSDQYDMAFMYFKKASEIEVKNLRTQLYAALDAYIDQNLTFDKKKIKILKDHGRMLQDMDEIVHSAMTYYRNPLDIDFRGFSDLVKDGIERVEDNRQNKFLGRKSSEAENLAKKDALVKDLKTQIHNEVDYLLNSGLMVLSDLRHVDNYKTEKTQNVFTLHGGYGGTYFNKDQKDDLFGRGFMAGITLPLGKKQFASPFWSHTSLMLGVYFNDFQLADHVIATGPLIKTPYYLGVGYKFYQFLRISVGGTLLENEATQPGQEVSAKIYVRPYISLTADINLWLGLAK